MKIRTRFPPTNNRERESWDDLGVFAWGGIMLNERTKLRVFHSDLPDIITVMKLSSLTISVVEGLLESEDVYKMDWLACPSDLNPIKHVRDVFGRQLVTRSYPPEKTRDLKQMLPRLTEQKQCHIFYHKKCWIIWN
ncbi:hypothetical protein TNCV_2877111 [Trichonephila clavipes]|uniref:Uncharacterized protein n=1 Tax=Trichonephila clavipes TaxID=2585209 RepID=A0A8X6WDD6_TRICX|nr:hypothetical protein TNCV_2877111 [Trichonephila clavipes]